MRLNNNRVIKIESAPYVIAELNTSHFGELEIAKEMIIKAAAIGVDCVKFQSWSTDSLYSQDYYDENKMAKRFVKKFSFSRDEMMELSQFCKEKGIDFASTPYSNDEVDYLLTDCQVPFIKVASMDINNLKFLRYIAETGSAVVLSTGMATFNEVKEAVEIFKRTGNNNLTILHCTSVYPSPPEIINLNNVNTLQEMFPEYEIGYSDHTIGIEVPLASIAMGCRVIEKHFTLDKSKIGMDNQMATEVEEFEDLIKSIKQVHKSLGNENRILSDSELRMKETMRRSLVAAVDISMGDTITSDMLTAKRPPSGIPPNQIDLIIGKQAQINIQKDRVIHFEDIK